MAHSVAVSAGINFKRDGESSTSHAHSECEGSAIIPIMSAFAGDGFPSFQSALVAQLGEGFLNTTIPDNYTAPGWNGTIS